MSSEPVLRREQIEVGPHTIAIEPPDLVVFAARGELSLQHTVEMIEFLVPRVAGRKYLLFLGDLTGFRDYTADARKALPRLSPAVPYRGMAMYGASFQARIVTKVALAVLNLFLRGDNPAHFCDTEADARVWLEGRRRLLAAESGG